MKITRIKITILLLFLYASNHFTYAQYQNFLNFKVNSQVPFSRINCLAIDKNNIKWLGTDNGFASFSGDSISSADKWQLYDDPNSSDTIFRKVSAITIDINGHKWLATYHDYDKNTALVELDRKGEFVRQYPLPNAGKKDMFINGITSDRYERKWVATEKAGVWVLDERNQWTNYQYEDIEQLRSNSIQSIAMDKGGMIWIGTDKGLCSVNDELYWEIYDVRDFVSSIATDRHYHVCLSIIDRKDRQKLYCDTDDFIEAEKRSRKNRFFFNDMTMDDKGVVWMAGNGLAKHEKGKRTLYNAENSNFYAQEATCLASDTKGDLWIGTIGKGLFKYILPQNQKQITSPPAEKAVTFALIKPLKSQYLKTNRSVNTIPNVHLFKIPKLDFPFDFDVDERVLLHPAQTKAVALLPIHKTSKKPAFHLFKIPKIDAPWQTPELIDEEDVKIGAKVNLPNIQFKPRSYELTSLKGVQALLEFMQMHPKVKIELEGHTDMNPPIGNPKYAKLSERFMKLSQQRINTVSSFLFKNGIKSSRVVMQAYGGTRPIEKKSNSEINRRVEMKIIGID